LTKKIKCGYCPEIRNTREGMKIHFLADHIKIIWDGETRADMEIATIQILKGKKI
jgi:hypothetical protein